MSSFEGALPTRTLCSDRYIADFRATPAGQNIINSNGGGKDGTLQLSKAAGANWRALDTSEKAVRALLFIIPTQSLTSSHVYRDT